MKVPRLSEADYQAALGVVEQEPWLFTVPSISEVLPTTGEPLLRIVRADGDERGMRFECDCDAGFMSARRTVCRHVRAVVAWLRLRTP